ncbi:class I SAM-dependent DNA methyltransferase [Glycomyces buryatensis]|uniref:Methyltransferase domain-containing protein n=1 Tax=Glycomyces buryatensis TaxID=2570927 RepID=A0A4S8QLI5_9ACTN|nr:class I SAM-dependent methyltransferase [Glycomyces buryatensis]THV41594.1 methyltransferase domain-containing protein [Glycomyces buryatensis]
MSEPDFLRTTRDSYDAAAEQYAELSHNTAEDFPLDRALVGVLAELAGATPPGTVADIGCGPGLLTGHLRDLGADVFGVDLSPEMLAIARREHPDITFTEGSLTSLEIADDALAGILSRYSIIHTPPEHLPGVFAEFHRVLAPGGHLLLSFFGNTDASQLAWPFDHKVALAYRLSFDRVAALLEDAGLTETARMIEQSPAHSRRGFESASLLFRKPA